MANIRPLGDGALTVELGETIDAGINAAVVALSDALRDAALPGVIETVPTYRSLLVRYDPSVVRGAALEDEILHRLEAAGGRRPAGRLWRVPVHYGGPAALDLDDLAAMKGLSVETLIALHSGAEYRVYMIGFAPGFAYLGGLPDILHTPRLDVPRQMVAAGSIGIGGRQASVNSLAGPSGWRYLGRTPLRLFDLDRREPALLSAGDLVRFRPIDAAEAERLDRFVEAGVSILEPETP